MEGARHLGMCLSGAQSPQICSTDFDFVHSPCCCSSAWWGHGLGSGSAEPMQSLFPRAYGVVSMCIGTGMGAAAVFEYPGN